MKERQLSAAQVLAKRSAHVRAMGLTDELKSLIRTEIAQALREMPAGLTIDEQNGYETACNMISRRLLAL